MAELREALAIGRRDHQPSDPHQAQQVYRQALRADPDNADALSRLGAACLVLGQFSEAATNFQKALRLRPHQAGLSDEGGLKRRRGGQRDRDSPSRGSEPWLSEGSREPAATLFIHP